MAEQSETSKNTDGASLPVRILRKIRTYVVGGLIGVFLFWLIAPSCKSSRVTNGVSSIVENQLLHLPKLSTSLTNIKAIETGLFGLDDRCTATIVEAGAPTLHVVEYHWDARRGSVRTIYARLTI